MDILHNLVELCDSAPESAQVCLKAGGCGDSDVVPFDWLLWLFGEGL